MPVSYTHLSRIVVSREDARVTRLRPDPRSLASGGDCLAVSARQPHLASMPTTGNGSSAESLSSALPHAGDSPESPRAMETDDPLPVDESDEFATVGRRRRPTKKPKRTHSTGSASSRTSAMDIGPSQGQQAAVPTASVTAPAAAAVGRAPPLFVHGVSNVAALYRRLIAAHGLSADKLDLKLLGGDTVKVVVRRLEDHRLVEAFLQAHSLQYHTFSPKRVKPLSVILRGLDAHTDPQEILLELRELGYPVQAIFRLFTNSETRVPLPLVRLHLEKGEAADKIFHLTRLFGFRIRVESCCPPGKLAQCHRCQRFGHHTDVCRSGPACLRCSLGHSTQACTVADKSQYRCINCGEGHAANYSNCPVYRACLLYTSRCV